MDTFLKVVRENSFVIIVMGLMLAGVVVFNIIRARGMAGSNKTFLARYPDAARIYLTMRGMVITETVSVVSVDDDKPQLFAEVGRMGFYLSPGEHVVEMRYSRTRPGVIIRRVTSASKTVRQPLKVEPNRAYVLDFNREEERFTINEM
ncbi:MAG: hypothetical protein LBH17_05015 [Oscillospiraceae bacterium]|jgi:hypothetical protein|nr:hypothetical protein [Oscillospiraceae bacterium]